MSNASDIKNLFAKFGGHPEHYRELAIENDAQASTARWPLLSTIVANRASHPPPVSPSPFQARAAAAAPPEPPASAPPVRPPYQGLSAARQAFAAPAKPSDVAPPPAPQAPRPVPKAPPAVASAAPAPVTLPGAGHRVPNTPLQGLLRRLSSPPPLPSAPLADPLPERGSAPVSTLLSRLAKR